MSGLVERERGRWYSDVVVVAVCSSLVMGTIAGVKLTSAGIAVVLLRVIAVWLLKLMLPLLLL